MSSLLKVSNGFALLSLNIKVYSRESVLNSISAFEKVCKVSRKELGDYLLLRIECEKDIEKVSLEFANYVLNLSRGEF